MFPLFSSLRECFPPTSQFNIDDIPDLTGKTVLITGANTGEPSNPNLSQRVPTPN
jgi:retinol dehydrogenase-12